MLATAGPRTSEIHDEWQVGERRYLSEGSMALLIKPPASSEGLATPALLKA
jgi:putative transposase